MATIDKRGPYQYRVRVRRKGYPEQVKTLETLDSAKKWARDIESKMDRGVFISMIEAETTTLCECLTRYLREKTANKKGWKQERCRIQRIQHHPLASRVMASIRSKDIAEYRDERMASPSVNSATTVLHELKIFSHVFNTARKEWGMEGLANPADSIAKPSTPRARDRRLVGDEEQRLLEAARENNPALHALIVVAIETAMRRGELASLRWKDIKGNIATSEDTNDEKLRKNGEKLRVPLSSRALAAIQALPRQLHDDRVFGLTADAITKAFRRICKRAGITNLRFHDLRHEATSRLFEKGLNPMQVAAITGHKTLQMLKRYTHLRAEDLVKMLG